MTQEEKAKAYDDAIKRAKRMFSEKELNYLFPELAESDDEKIISAIRKAIEAKVENLGNGVTRTACLAWLEKQGNTNIFDIPKISIKNAVEVTSRMQYIDNDIKPIAEFIMDYANWDLHKDKWNQPTLTIPLFRVLDALIQKDKPYCVCSQNIEKQGEQKPADEVKPKFHKGDWVIDKQGIVHQVANVVEIENVTNHTYGYDIVGGGYFNDNAEGVRLWNMSDANEGDVLVDSLGNVCIYQEPSTKLMYHSHCYGNHKFFIPMGGSHEIVGSYPATKEQRDQLEKAMADAGYAFDFEKKELKEIEQKPAEWSEEDESNFQGIIDELKANKHHAPDSDLPTYDIFLSWFKSLKERYVWKPSNEQMKILSIYKNVNDVLASLYQDLKKL